MFGGFYGCDYVPLPTTPYRAPTLHILREQADRERASQRQARTNARRAMHSVAGRRAQEVRAALSVRNLSMKRAA